MKVIKPTKAKFVITPNEVKVIKDLAQLCNDMNCCNCNLYGDDEKACILSRASSFTDVLTIVRRYFTIEED